jgi:hypothetical protein
MSQQLFAQQQFLMSQQQSAQSKSTGNGISAKLTVSPAQKRNKLSIDEILKQRVKPTNVAVVETDDQDQDLPTDTSGSNGIGEEEEADKVNAETMEIKAEEQANCSQA